MTDIAAELADILSSGPVLGLSGCHEDGINEVVEREGKEKVLAALPELYADCDPSEIREGELEYFSQVLGVPISFGVKIG